MKLFHRMEDILKCHRDTKSLLYSRKEFVLEINAEKSKNVVPVLLGYDTASLDVMIGIWPFETA